MKLRQVTRERYKKIHRLIRLDQARYNRTNKTFWRYRCADNDIFTTIQDIALSYPRTTYKAETVDYNFYLFCK